MVLKIEVLYNTLTLRNFCFRNFYGMISLKHRVILFRRVPAHYEFSFRLLEIIASSSILACMLFVAHWPLGIVRLLSAGKNVVVKTNKSMIITPCWKKNIHFDTILNDVRMNHVLRVYDIKRRMVVKIPLILSQIQRNKA